MPSSLQRTRETNYEFEGLDPFTQYSVRVIVENEFTTFNFPGQEAETEAEIMTTEGGVVDSLIDGSAGLYVPPKCGHPKIRTSCFNQDTFPMQWN